VINTRYTFPRFRNSGNVEVVREIRRAEYQGVSCSKIKSSFRAMLAAFGRSLSGSAFKLATRSPEFGTRTSEYVITYTVPSVIRSSLFCRGSGYRQTDRA
jgi:hypothetical protein